MSRKLNEITEKERQTQKANKDLFGTFFMEYALTSTNICFVLDKMLELEESLSVLDEQRVRRTGGQRVVCFVSFTCKNESKPVNAALGGGTTANEFTGTSK